MAGGELVVGTLAREQRPGATLSPALVRTAVFPLAVAVVVVATPDGTGRSVDLENGIEYLERVDDERIVWASDAIPNEFEEAAIDDLTRFELGLFVGGAIGDADVIRRDRRIEERADPLPVAGCACNAV